MKNIHTSMTYFLNEEKNEQIVCKFEKGHIKIISSNTESYPIDYNIPNIEYFIYMLYDGYKITILP